MRHSPQSRGRLGLLVSFPRGRGRRRTLAKRCDKLSTWSLESLPPREQLIISYPLSAGVSTHLRVRDRSIRHIRINSIHVWRRGLPDWARRSSRRRRSLLPRRLARLGRPRRRRSPLPILRPRRTRFLRGRIRRGARVSSPSGLRRGTKVPLTHILVVAGANSRGLRGNSRWRRPHTSRRPLRRIGNPSRRRWRGRAVDLRSGRSISDSGTGRGGC